MDFPRRDAEKPPLLYEGLEVHAQRDGDVAWFQGREERLIRQARRDAIYEVETFLEENQVALFRWDHRGGEKVLGEEVGVGIIRRLLEV